MLINYLIVITHPLPPALSVEVTPNVIETKSYLATLFLFVLSCLSCVQLSAILWTVACQAPLSMGFSRQEYWSGLPCPAPGHLPDLEIEPTSPVSICTAGGFFTTDPPEKPLFLFRNSKPV